MEKAQSVRIRELLLYSALGLLLLALIATCIIYWPKIDRLVHSTEAVRDWISGFGPWAPLVFIGLQFLQVVVFVIPGEVTQLAGGYLFGTGLGFLYALVGSALGTVFAFSVARKLGLAFVTKLFGQAQVGKFEGFLSSSKAMVIFFLLFLIPGIPKDILYYIGGLSYIRLPWFLAISLVGRLPGLLGSAIIGNAAAELNIPLLIAVGIIAGVLFTLGIIYRKNIMGWVEALAAKAAPKGSQGADKAGARTPGGKDDPALYGEEE